MNVIAMVGIALAAAIFVTLLRQSRPELALLVGMAACVLILLSVISACRPVVELLRGLLSKTGVDSSYGTILLKSLGVCFLTRLGGDVCKDAGETSLAGKIELVGRVTVLGFCLPLIAQVVQLIIQLTDS